MMNEAAGEMLEGERQTRVSKRNSASLTSCGVTLYLSVIVFFAVSVSSRPATAEQNAPPAVRRLDDIATVRPLLKQYCYECHSAENAEAEIDFDVVAADSSAGKNVEIWLKVRGMLDSGQMPPKESPQLTRSEKSKLRKWVHEFLMNEARAHAGDPGPVVLRRLTNDEYNYTVRDLTKVKSLDPTREFPVDSAAGEGFTNSGSAQSMSPALVTKYMNAAKEVADHTVFLPSGIRFSRYTTRRDQTDELLARIQDFYRRFTQEGGGTSVNLQGIKFDTNQGGLLPYEKYLAATIEERDALAGKKTTIAEVAAKRSLNPRYLDTLWRAMTRDGKDSSAILINRFRQRWQNAKPGDVPTLVAEIAAAQKTLWKFNSIGHIGREGGAKSWLEPVSPITTQQEFRIPLPESPRGSDVVLYLTADDLGDGNAADFVVWNRPRLEFKADSNGTTQRPILLRDMRSSAERVDEIISTEIPRTAKYLEAVSRLYASSVSFDDIVSDSGLNAHLLKRWGELLGLGRRTKRDISGRYTNKLARVQGYADVNGWGAHQTPSLLTNRSKDDIRFLTLTVPARGVTVHPSPTHRAVIAWQSPIEGPVQIDGLVADVDNSCGNGVRWQVELLSESGVTILASGTLDNGGEQPFRSKAVTNLHQGDVVSLVVASRDNSHACDTTHIDLRLSEVGGEARKWDLASDIVDKILESNPLPDSYGHADTWHFCSTGSKSAPQSKIVPGSTLAQWRSAVVGKKSAGEIKQFAASVQHSLNVDDTLSISEPDRRLRQQLKSWRGPLRWLSLSAESAEAAKPIIINDPSGNPSARFGKHPNGSSIDAASLCVKAPQILEMRIPAALAVGAELVVTGQLHSATGLDGSVQLQVLTDKPKERSLSPTLPVLVQAGSQKQLAVAAAMTEFRNLFPPSLCYARIVPVDEVVTLRLFYREDDHLKRLMLDDAQAAELDRLWDELFYVSHEPLQLAVSFEQLTEFATQDRPDLVTAFEPLRKPINDRADAFRLRLQQTEPTHLRKVIELADLAWRRPLVSSEKVSLQELYRSLRDSDLSHEEAIRLTWARVLTSPDFLYRRESVGPGKEATPVSGNELAIRLSYFLWSSLPDRQLRQIASSGKLTSDDVLLEQTRRMSKDPRTRRLAIQFACQWLHLRNFDQNDDKNEALYPKFSSLRTDMYEEVVRFFDDMFRNDGSILDILDANHTFVNKSLAEHYGMPGINGNEWKRVDDVRVGGRGGILGMAAFLASQSGASRTSPILRGNWVSETLLGERLPRPPANVPQLPETVPAGLTARQLIEHHTAVPECAKCHIRIDPYGFALEQYDAIGRLRTAVVDTKTTLVDGKTIERIDGLRDYLTKDRRDDFVRQFCRKLLGYGLGREVQLSDEPLLEEMLDRLAKNDYRVSVAIETIVLSRQFREIRGQQEINDHQ